jgi:hypothetical protein
VTVADYADVTDEQQQDTTPETLLAATLALQVAVDQLTQPGLERLDRSRAEADEAVKAVEAEHAAHALELQAAHALALHRRDEMGILRARARITAHELRARARAVTQAPLPSLLEQLLDAVGSSQLAANGAAGSVHRIPIDPKAVELVAEIQRAVYGQPGGTPTAQLRNWAAALTEENNATALPEAAQWAERWVVRAREIVAPDDIEQVAVEPCPRCGNSWVHARDDTGEIVRKPALQVRRGRPTPSGNTVGGEIRCMWQSCGARWPQIEYDFLVSLMEQKRRERAEAEAQRKQAG